MDRRPEPSVLAIDIGTSSVRSALFDETARRLPETSASEVYELRHSAEHGAELDPHVLLRAHAVVFARVARVLSPGEWIFEELVDVRACSHSMASGTGLYNFARRDWDHELVDLCGLTISKMASLRDKTEARNQAVFSALGD